MPLSVILLLLAAVAAFASLACLWVSAFRTSVVWGLVALFVPFGFVAFTIKHWSKAGKFFILYLICSGACGPLFFNSPSLVAAAARLDPRVADLVKQVNPQVYAESQKLPGGNADMSKAAPTPHEVRDLAENETPDSATPPPDPNAAQRAAYTKHAKELNTLYQQLNAERPKLKAGSPAVAAFNAKAARYQQGLQTLAEEKVCLDTLDHATLANTEAAAALVSLQTSARIGDYEAFATTLRKSLADYRQTSAFPQIVALARSVLPQATPDKVLAGLQAKTATTGHADFDKTTRQIQGIVNQVPQIVPKPSSGEVYHYGFHPGATKPDFNTENLLATRELWNGDYAYMDEAPGVFYRAGDCEFNPQTKYFYTSRSVPKKRLNDTEYKELTRLYHLLGQQEKAVANVTPPTSKDAERVRDDLKAQIDGYAMK